MSQKIKTTNEYTVKITVTKSEFLDFLKEHGFYETEPFSLDDYYFVPNNLNLSKLSTRSILSHAILFRNIYRDGICKKKLAFKEKEFDAEGNILNQKATYCSVYDADEAISFLKAIGYKELMNIKENSIAFSNNDIEFALKDIVGGNLLMEFELDGNDSCDSMDDLRKKILSIGFPIDTSDFFVKKAELHLDKVLGRNP